MNSRLVFLVGIIVVMSLLIYSIRSVLTPFIFSLVIAYLLNPLVNHLHKKYKASRLLATSLITITFFLLITLIGIITLPLIYAQISGLVISLPDYFKIIINDVYPRLAGTLNSVGFKLNPDFFLLLENANFATKFVDVAKNIFENAISSSIAIINILSLIFLTPIIVFYLLKDWNVFVEKLNHYLPHNLANSIAKVFKEMNHTLAGYVRGQINVCIILAVIYATLLSLAGLNFGALIGLFTGLLIFIPYVGMLCGVMAATIIGLVQWGLDSSHIGIIAAIFIFGQVIESNFLTPNIIGSRIGLNPVWIIFGIFVFGALFGFFGVIFAMPLTAIASVIIKHLAVEYKARLDS